MPLKHGVGRERMNVSSDSQLKLMERLSVCFDLCALTRHQAFEIKCVKMLRLVEVCVWLEWQKGTGT